MIDTASIPDRYKVYRWEDKHKLFGYPADEYPHFYWITSLEERFARFKSNPHECCPTYLIVEMLKWGGSQNGVSEKFMEGLGSVSLHDILIQTVEAINDPEQAVGSALRIPGLGLTYASKLLRFLDPVQYGAIDSIIRKALNASDSQRFPKIYDGNRNSMVRGFVSIITWMRQLRDELNACGIYKPSIAGADIPWRTADVEMAIFSWAQSVNSNRGSITLENT